MSPSLRKALLPDDRKGFQQRGARHLDGSRQGMIQFATAEFFALVLFNPISMAVSLLVFMVMHVYQDAGTNTLVFDKRFFPLW